MLHGWGGGEPVFARLLQRGLEEQGVEVLLEASIRRSVLELATLALTPYDADPFRVAQYRRRLKQIHPDVVLAWYDFDCAWIVAAQKESIPVVACVQIWWPLCPVGTFYIEGEGNCNKSALAKCVRHMSRAPLSPNLELPVAELSPLLALADYAKLWTRPAALSQADAIVVPSEFAAAKFRQHGYRRVHAIGDAVDLELFRPSPLPEGSKLVLYPVARSMQERKGYPHFRAMAESVRRLSPTVRFRVLNHVGDTLLEGSPYLSHEELANLFRSVYMAVVPGLWDEPFGTVLVEAMASSRPVVAYGTGGIPEVVENGVSGILLPRGDLEGLTEAVLDLLHDERKAARLGAAARRRAEELFGYKTQTARYLSLINQLLEGGRDVTTRHPIGPVPA
jgi:glycosyltransferase involved in cell wall biosynthesis